MGCGDSKDAEAKVEENEAGGIAREDETRYQHPSDNDGDEEIDKGDAKAPSRFALDGPSRDADAAVNFFHDILYKVDAGEDGWFFYNDNARYEVHLNFKTKSELEKGDVDRADADGSGFYSFSGVVYPGETKQWFVGQPNGFKYSISAKGLSDAYCKRIAAENNAKLQDEIKAVEKLREEVREAEPRSKENDSSDDEDETEAILSACIKSKTPYVDLEFLPCDASLSKQPNRGGLPNVAWKRPTEYLSGENRDKVKLIRDSVEPNDIDQGRLGDCWFLCAVASLAEQEAKVRDMFRHPSRKLDITLAEREVGAYRVTLNKHGWWHVTIVDDLLPCVGSTPCFAKNVEDPAELWVSLLEKAFAKAHGSYKAIVAGDALQALQDLSGYPALRFDDWEKADESLFRNIVRYDEAGYMINLNTPGQDESSYMGHHNASNPKEFSAAYKKAGLGMGHAYSVLQAKEFPKHNVKLLQIRNPWGNGTEWTGDWSDDSKKWEEFPDIKKACNPAVEADGTFWMDWVNAKKYFDGGGVCFMKENWYDYRVRGVFSDAMPSIVLEVTVKKDVEVFFILSQKDRRGLDEKDPDRTYKGMMCSVCTYDEGKKKYAATINTQSNLDEPGPAYYYCRRRDNALLTTLKASDEPYLVVPRIHKQGAGELKDFTLGMISSSPCSGDLQVAFKKPPKDWSMFKNYVHFPYEKDKFEKVNTKYQFNPEVGCPVTKVGAAFKGKK